MYGNSFSPLTTPRRALLMASMFVAMAAAPVAGIDSQVARVQVPDGSMLALLHDQPMSLYLQARFQVGRVAGAPGAPVTVTAQVNTEGRKLLRTTRAAPALPTLDHPDFTAYTLIAGGQWTPARITRVDLVTGEVDVETPSNAGQVRVYYTFGDGEIALHAGRPFGSSSGLVQLFRSAARAIHETDQANRNTAIYSTINPQPLPQRFGLFLTVRAASAVYFDGLARHEIAIPITETAIQVNDAALLAEGAERQLKGV